MHMSVLGCEKVSYLVTNSHLFFLPWLFFSFLNETQIREPSQLARGDGVGVRRVLVEY